MRILFVNRMLHMERGGGETFDLEMARHLQAFGHEISFLSGIPLTGRAKIREPFSDYLNPVADFQIRSPYFGWVPWDKMKGGWRLRVYDFTTFERRAVNWVMSQGRDFDVVHACELPFFVAEAKRRAYKVPIVLRLTAPNYFDSWGGIKAADAVIASGETVAHVRKTVRADCYDVPNGVDTKMFRPQRSVFRSRHGLSDANFVILYVARFQDFKNHALLVNAFEKLSRRVPNARLVLVGSGPLQRRVRKKSKEQSVADRVLFLGEQRFEEMPDIYAAADVLAISSDFESFCFAALEAMATGLPIVTTDCGWVPKLLGKKLRDLEYGARNARLCVAREGGLVVPCRDAERLAEGLTLLADRPDLRSAMGRWNQEKVAREHGWGASATRLMEVYRRLGIHEGCVGT